MAYSLDIKLHKLQEELSQLYVRTRGKRSRDWFSVSFPSRTNLP